MKQFTDELRRARNRQNKFHSRAQSVVTTKWLLISKSRITLTQPYKKHCSLQETEEFSTSYSHK